MAANARAAAEWYAVLRLRSSTVREARGGVRAIGCRSGRSRVIASGSTVAGDPRRTNCSTALMELASIATYGVMPQSAKYRSICRRVAKSPVSKPSGWTAMHEAIVYGDGSARYREVVAALLAAGADPSIQDGAGRTASENA